MYKRTRTQSVAFLRHSLRLCLALRPSRRYTLCLGCTLPSHPVLPLGKPRHGEWQGLVASYMGKVGCNQVQGYLRPLFPLTFGRKEEHDPRERKQSAKVWWQSWGPDHTPTAMAICRRVSQAPHTGRKRSTENQEARPPRLQTRMN